VRARGEGVAGDLAGAVTHRGRREKGEKSADAQGRVARERKEGERAVGGEKGGADMRA
jgi:hypothetical protein